MGVCVACRVVEVRWHVDELISQVKEWYGWVLLIAIKKGKETYEASLKLHILRLKHSSLTCYLNTIYVKVKIQNSVTYYFCEIYLD